MTFDENIPAPDALRARIAQDLAPVSPLPPPSRRVLVLLPIALSLLYGSVWIFGLRRDAPALGLLLTWGASLAEMCLGLILCAAALREAVPGTTLSRRMIGGAFVTSVLGVVLVTWLTWLTSPTRIAPEALAWVWTACLGATVLTALPPLAFTGWLVARAFPLRPAIAGALYGLGSGLMADAGWRLFCHFSDPTHVFGAHVVGIAVACGVGVGLAKGMRGTGR